MAHAFVVNTEKPKGGDKGGKGGGKGDKKGGKGGGQGGDTTIRPGLRMWGQSPEGPIVNAFNTSSNRGDATDEERIAWEMRKTKCMIRTA